MVVIIPSILVADAQQLTARLQLLEKNNVPVAQLDVADHTFVPARTFADPDYLDAAHPRVAFEIHLMTSVTDATLKRWQRPWVEKIIFHLEASPEPGRILQAIADLGKKTGLALNPETPIENAKPFLHLTDTLLVMGVTPGRGGQTLLPDTVARVRQARNLHRHGNVEVDGGVNVTTIPALAAAGANLFIVGSALQEKNFSTIYNQLTTLANAAFKKT